MTQTSITAMYQSSHNPDGISSRQANRREMQRFVILVLLTWTLASTVRGEGIAPASFSKDVVPLLHAEPGLLGFTGMLELKDEGRCLANWEGPPYHTFPFVFKARLRGDNKPYSMVLVIGRTDAEYDPNSIHILASSLGQLKSKALWISLLPIEEAPLKLK